MPEHVLLCDISNGTDLKLALARRGERPGDVSRCPCDSLETFKAAITDFLGKHGNPRLMGCAISAAGWEKGGVVKLPNHGFSIDRSDIRQFLVIQRVNLVNDFVAKALAIPRLEKHERAQICGGEVLDEQVIAVVGAHNGLGLSALAPDGMGGWMAMASEGGHSDLATTNALEDAVLRILIEKYGHVSRERVISIPALLDLWRALAIIDGESGEGAPSPADIIAKAHDGDARCRKVIELSLGWFAAFAADVALIIGARGGIYLTGELLSMVGDLFDVEAFVARYGEKGRLSDYVSEIPVFKTTASDIEVIGLATLFD